MKKEEILLRKIRKCVSLNESEAAALSRGAEKAGLPECAFIRMLIMGYVPNEKMPDEFYEFIRTLSAIADNLNQLTVRAFRNNFFGREELEVCLKRLEKFEKDVYIRFIEPKRSD